jgi:hypothetical protein
MSGLKVALFVEGSTVPLPKHKQQPLHGIWNDCFGRALGLRPFDPIVPISKKHLVAMDPANPKMSGAGEALDVLVARMLKHHAFEVAVVAWDLVPAWNPDDSFCRWEETLKLYRFLAGSNVLPEVWKEQAATRYKELSRRRLPGDRSRPPALRPGMVLPVCMEPMFESVLVQDEAAVRRVLGIQGRSISDWPSQGWGDLRERRPDENILAPAIRAVSRVRPKLQACRIVGGDLKTKKNEWGEYLFRRMLSDSRVRPGLLDHPISRRLVELVGQ